MAKDNVVGKEIDIFGDVVEKKQVHKSLKKEDGTNKPAVTSNAGDNEWYTPAEYVEPARALMGRIDVDPASSALANTVVQASTFYTAEDNGLLHEWRGKVFMNPPYEGKLIKMFVKKICEEYRSGAISEAVILVNNATETAWFQELLAHASAVCWVSARIRFWHPRKTAAPLQGQAILYLGKNPRGFRDGYRKFGICLTEFTDEIST